MFLPEIIQAGFLTFGYLLNFFFFMYSCYHDSGTVQETAAQKALC